MIGKVVVKEEYLPGHSLKPGVYKLREDLCFDVDGPVPSALRKLARTTFEKRYAGEYVLLSCTCTDRDAVQILFRHGQPKTIIEPGWEHRGPQGPKPRRRK